MRLRNKKGRLFGTLLGTVAGLLVSYAIWGSEMWTWGVPSGIPIVFGAAVGCFLGYQLEAEKSEKERQLEQTLSGVGEAGARGLFLGTGIGMIVMALPALVCWLFLSVPGSICVIMVLLGASTGGVLGFLSTASTRHKGHD